MPRFSGKEKAEMEENGIEAIRPRLAVFHKHMKNRAGMFGGRAPRVSVPIEDIRTISESHIDGTTLVRTSDGGTIAIEESFDEANRIWAEA